MADLTRILAEHSAGESQEMNQLVAAVYPELRRIAHAHLRSHFFTLVGKSGITSSLEIELFHDKFLSEFALDISNKGLCIKTYNVFKELMQMDRFKACNYLIMSLDKKLLAQNCNSKLDNHIEHLICNMTKSANLNGCQKGKFQGIILPITPIGSNVMKDFLASVFRTSSWMKV